jgi:hypothetical protein
VTAATNPRSASLTPIDFSESNRRPLQSASSDRFGLTTHHIVEERLAREDAQTVNIMRILLILDEDKLNRLGDAEDPKNNIKLTDRVIDQFNEGLALLEQPVDLTADIEAFAAQLPDSPINSVIQQICFYPEDDRRCEAPANQSEIDQLEAELETFEDDEKESDEYKTLQARLQELREKTREIEEGRRAVGDRSVTTVETFLVEQTRRYHSIAARDYYITPFELSIPASDTGIKTLEIRSFRGAPDLTGLDAISTNQDAVMVPRWSAQVREVDFYITGDPGTEGEVRISFRPAGDYRWFQSQVRPVIE